MKLRNCSKNRLRVKEDCSFCSELNNCEYNNIFLQIFKGSLPSRILKETTNFVVMPTLGQIVEGYLLIVSKKHYLSIGDLPYGYFDELSALKKETFDVLTKAYKSPIFFEHGAISYQQRGGCCVTHLHLNAIPTNVDLLPKIMQHLEGKRIQSILEIKRQFKKKTPYLFYETPKGEKYLFDAFVIPSQYLRQLLAVELNLRDKWDWRRHIGKDKVIATLKKLSFWYDR